MLKPCKDCPFTAESEGHPYLHAERMEGIKFGLSMGQPFYCHKTVHHQDTEFIVGEDGEEHTPSWSPNYKLCRGAIDYAESIQEKDDV